MAAVDWLSISFAPRSFALLLGAGVVLSLAVGHRRLVGTTLMAAWWWSLIAVVGIVGSELLVATIDTDAWVPAVRYFASIVIFCPVVSVLGAKRPQDRAWQLIVLSLWTILALPAFTALLFSHTFQVSTVWSFFLLALLGISVLNYLPTCYWPASLLVGAGQVCLLGDHLALIRSLDVPLLAAAEARATLVAWALLFVLCATLVVHWIARRRRRRLSQQPLNRLWLDFRDTFGAMWGLRVVERINSAASLNDWNVVLRWDGFRATNLVTGDKKVEPETTGESDDAIQTSFTNLLRRFVSPEWIEQRSGARQETVG